MPPEYAVHGQFSVKSDVFSYGVILLEIVSGKKNRGFSDPEHYLNLLGHVSPMTSQFPLFTLLHNRSREIFWFVSGHPYWCVY